MASKVPIVSVKELEALHTGSLMSRREALLQCEESFDLSDQTAFATEPGFIEFKNTKEWKQAYSDLKQILSGRENIPNKNERKAIRQAKARASK